MRRIVAPFGVALAATTSSSSFAGPTRSSTSSSSSSTGAAAPVLSLQPPHVLRTPSQTFQRLADECEQEGIDDFDVYGDLQQDASTSFLRRFEQLVANELGKEDAVFMPSGVVAQSIALLIHSKRKAAEEIDDEDDVDSERHGDAMQDSRRQSRAGRGCFACHESSHLLLHEKHGYHELLDMDAVILPSPDHEITNDDDRAEDGGVGTVTTESDRSVGRLPLDFATVQRELDKHFQQCQHDPASVRRVSTLLLEVPHREQGGQTTSYDDILAMKQYCHDHNLRFHCDGARIFEATAAYPNLTLSELVQPFDSVYVSFYKGLGGLSGAMLLGSVNFCDEARVWLRRFGGNLYTLLPYALSGSIGFQQHWLLPQHFSKEVESNTPSPFPLSFVDKKNKMVEIVAALSSHPDISQLVRFDPKVPHVNMVHGYLKCDPATCQRALDAVEARTGIRVLTRVRSTANEAYPPRRKASALGYRSFFEWSIGEGNGRIPTSTVVTAWTELAKELLLLEPNLPDPHSDVVPE